MLHVNNICVSYKRSTILRNISLEVMPGEIVAITGANGCGKTTLLRALSGLIRSKGKVTISIETQENCPAFSGFVETPKLWNHLTGMENVAFILGRFYRRDLAEQMFFDWGLSYATDMLVKKYSLGMRQKLALIISFATQSNIILFDEPTNALDIDGIRLFCEYVTRASQQKRSVIIATHDIYRLRSICTKEYSLRDGSIYETNHSKDSNKKFVIRFASLEDRDSAFHAIETEQNVHCTDSCSVILCVDEERIPDYIRLLDRYNIIEVTQRSENVVYKEAP